MDPRKQWRKSRVVKIDSKKSWDDSITQATKACCPIMMDMGFRGTKYAKDDLTANFNFVQVMVNFSAYWCMPSVAMEPCFEKLAADNPNILFLKVDVDEVKEVASMMNIKAMPTFLLMNVGEEVNKIVGANQDELKKLLDEFVNELD